MISPFARSRYASPGIGVFRSHPEDSSDKKLHNMMANSLTNSLIRTSASEVIVGIETGSPTRVSAASEAILLSSHSIRRPYVILGCDRTGQRHAVNNAPIPS